LVSIAKESNSLHVAIIGGRGMGKTTLALSFLHQQTISTRYTYQYFVSCEGKFTVDQLLWAIADILHISPDQRQNHLEGSILVGLQKDSTILCLDNLETIWESSSTRQDIEDFLSKISNIKCPDIGLVVTLRGTQRPNKIDWSYPLLEALSPLEFPQAVQVVEEIVNNTANEALKKLIWIMEGIPLAITLISHLIRV